MLVILKVRLVPTMGELAPAGKATASVRGVQPVINGRNNVKPTCVATAHSCVRLNF